MQKSKVLNKVMLRPPGDSIGHVQINLQDVTNKLNGILKEGVYQAMQQVDNETYEIVHPLRGDVYELTRLQSLQIL